MSKELEKVISRLSQKSKEEEKLKEEEEKEEEKEEEEEEEEGEEETSETPKLSKKTNSQLEELEQQVIRLRDNGIYRVEMLYQLQQINEFLKKLTGEDEKEGDKKGD